MDIQTVGSLQSKSIQQRYFFDIAVRRQTEQLILAFAKKIKFPTVKFEWYNIGDEEDIHEAGVALRVNDHYEIRYKLISETFNFWYYDHVNPTVIIEDVVDGYEDIESVLKELFKCMVEEAGRLVILSFMNQCHSKIPRYPDEPVKQRPTMDERDVARFLQR